MPNSKLSDSLRSVFDYAKSVLGDAELRERSGTQKGSATAVEAHADAPQEAFRYAVDHEQRRSFTDGVTTIQAIAHRVDVIGKQSVNGEAVEHIACATLAIPSSNGGDAQTLRLSVADLKKVAAFFTSSAAGELVLWILSRVGEVHASVKAGTPEVAPDAKTKALVAELKLLGYGQLISWAKRHRDDADALDAVCEAFRHNLARWVEIRGKAWFGLKTLAKIEKRAKRLRDNPEPPSAVESSSESTSSASSAPQPAKRIVSQPYVNKKGIKSLLLGLRGKHQRLIFHSLKELVGLINELRTSCAFDVVSFAERHFEGQEIQTPLKAEWVVAESHVSKRGRKSILFGLCGKQSRLVFHSQGELVEFLNDIRKRPGYDLAVLLEQHLETSAPSESDDPVWPVEAVRSQAESLSSDCFWYQQGVLSFLGYRVGQKSSLSEKERHRILDYVVDGRLPQVNNRHYMEEWGDPKSEKRLHKTARAIAAFARNARKQKFADKHLAIQQWELDLRYLKVHYYDDRWAWRWPKTGSVGAA